MVRSLLGGRKTQTRRICKNQPYGNGFAFEGDDYLCHNDHLPPSAMLMDVYRGGKYLYATSNMEGWEAECPHGQPGDRLWVREAWRAPTGIFDGMPPRDIRPGTPIRYEADGLNSSTTFSTGKLRPSMFMPRWASRITLEIVSVRVERLQDISEADAQAEGWTRRPEVSTDPQVHKEAARDWFMDLWESINGAGSWDANPWVWVVEFRRLS